MPAFYTSVVANLTFRFDETLVPTSQPDAPAESSTVGELPSAGTSATDALTEATVRASTDPSVSMNEALTSATVGASTDPGAPRAGDEVTDVTGRTEPILEPVSPPRDDQLTQTMAIIPIKATWELPGVRQAGRFSIELDFRDAPIDPRLVRSAGVSLHVGTVPAGDFARGMGGQATAGGQRLSILQQRRTDLLKNEGTLILSGSADTIAVKFGESKSTVTISGRDTRGMLLDIKVPLELLATMDITKPLDEVLADILATIPADTGLHIDVSIDDTEWPDGVLPHVADPKGLCRVRRGADGKGAKSTPAGAASDVSYWDLITQRCLAVGGIPHLIGTVLWVRPAHSIWARRLDDALDTPFKGAKPRIVGGDVVRVRRLVYGRDLKTVEYERKYTGVNAPIVEVVSICDHKRGEDKRITAQWPPKGSRAAKLKGDDERITVPFPGIVDEEKLLNLAREIYEEIGRGEMGGRASTKNMSSFGGDNDDPDLVRLRPTDGIELLVDARAISSNAPLVSEINSHEQRSFEEEVAEVASRIGDPVFARVLVSVARGTEARAGNFFRVNTVRGAWDVNSGIQISFDFQNYVASRHEEKAEGDVVEEVSRRKVKTKRVKRSAKNDKRPKKGASNRPRRNSRFNDAANAVIGGGVNVVKALQKNDLKRRLIQQGFSEEDASTTAAALFR